MTKSVFSEVLVKQKTESVKKAEELEQDQPRKQQEEMKNPFMDGQTKFQKS